MIKDTKNIAIEYFSRGKASGISVTKAEFFITYFPLLNEIWLIKVEKLKKLLKEDEKIIKKVIHTGDDGSNTKLCLLNREKYKPHFRVSNLY
jgi:hypothetical protein